MCVNVCIYAYNLATKMHRYLSINTAQQIGLALLMSNMDYCNRVFYGELKIDVQNLYCIKTKTVTALMQDIPYTGY